MAMDVLIMPVGAPVLFEGDVQVRFTASGMKDIRTVQDPLIPGRTVRIADTVFQVTFGVNWQFGASAAATQTAILNAAYDAYVVWCAGRGITPELASAIRREIKGY